MSPNGNLDWNSHNYTSLGFAAGAPGQNPASWSTAGTGDSGIQNAQYLWRAFFADYHSKRDRGPRSWFGLGDVRSALR